MKNKTIRKIIRNTLTAAGIAVLFSFTVNAETNQMTEQTGTVTRDEKFNSANVSLSPEEFEQAGFQLGDSCDIEFENGYTILDVPFYNGYYVKNGSPVIVAYPGFEKISITYNNMGIWDEAELTEGENVHIQLNTAGKYAPVQEALGQVYSFERADYESDEEFCNFHAMAGGNLKDDFLYRGASPVDNSRGRAAYTDGLLAEKNIQQVIDLADSAEDMERYKGEEDFASPYAASLFENGQIALLDMGSAYQSQDYQQKLADGMKQMLKGQGPVYIHCMEGKDRTGFVCMLLEALAGASYEEMRSDYMITYKNYYSVDQETSPEKYDAIAELYFDSFTCFLHHTEDMEEIRTADYTDDAAEYLLAGGMTEEEIELLKEFITK